MSQRPCPHLARDRSALVDDALEPGRRERLLAHLVHCSACRADVADLRRVRAALRTPPPAEAPQELAQRLISIAGAEARLPLWSRPFRRTRPGRLSSRRHTLRARATTAVAVGATVAGVAVVGYAAAPATAGDLLPDPSVEAQSAFGAAVAQFPLANDAVGAVLAAGPSHLGEPGPTAASVLGPARGRRLSDGEARAVLGRAVSAADTVSYTGVQRFRASAAGQELRASVQVRAVAGQGVQTQVLDRSGRPVGQGFTPTTPAPRMVDDKLVELLGNRYQLTGRAVAEAAGRPATLVEAWRHGRLAARWWVDQASGIVLGQQTFDAHQEVATSVAFASLEVQRDAPALGQLTIRFAVPSTGTALTLSTAPDLARQGWVCRDELAGLSLVRLRSDSAAATGALHLVYSDGVATVSVLEQHGRLAGAPRGTAWDTELRAYTRNGAAGLASWQSGGTVLTVVTDGPRELLAAVVASLPHEALPERTTMGRIREGWARLLADMKG